jgi:hypothetical protein
VRERQVAKHRLAYVPCPYAIELDLLEGDESFAEVMEGFSQVDNRTIAMRSPIRFDFDLDAARSQHPASHMTFNSEHCRMACVAPMHVGRFIDFVFRNFYPEQWRNHAEFFNELSDRHIGDHGLTDEDRAFPHITWPRPGLDNLTA